MDSYIMIYVHWLAYQYWTAYNINKLFNFQSGMWNAATTNKCKMNIENKCVEQDRQAVRQAGKCGDVYYSSGFSL